MKKLFLISAICFLGQISFGQTNVEVQKKAEPSNDQKLAEFKARHDELTAKNRPLLYFGYDETLKTFFSNDAIPQGVPKADGTISKEEYVKMLNKWISENKSLLKPEHTNSLIK